MSRWWWILLPFLVGWAPVRECFIYDGEGDKPYRVRLDELKQSAWTPVDLSPSGVPADAVSATLTGVIVITHGSIPAMCWMEAYARPTGKQWNVYAKAVETDVSGGVRHPWTFTIKLSEAKFDLWWASYGATEPWPAGCAFGIAMIVGEWCR